jgi:hypothetical protein
VSVSSDIGLNGHSKFGGGSSDTLLHPVVLAVLLVTILLVLVLPRKYVVIPFIISSLFVPLGQQVVIGSVHFFVLRIIIIAGCCRMLIARFGAGDRIAEGGLTTVDKIFIAWALARALCFSLLYSDSAAVINQIGFLIDALGGYAVLRYLIREMEDISRAIKVLAAVAFTVGVCMVYERLYSHNLFGILGGVGEIPAIREGKIRCQGVFQHAILAGIFGGTLVPLFLWLSKDRKQRLVACLGVIGAVCMVVTSASSTPLLALVAGIIGLIFWPLRSKMRTVRWSIVAILLILAFVMNAPVWFVIAHVDLVGGSSGYQRALLVDQFIRHFSDWWLLGAPNNGDWGWDMWDVQNQFVAEGELGGLLTFVLFVDLVSIIFKTVGSTRRLVAGTSDEWFIWTLGAVMLSHVAAFFGANYFDQIRIWWYAFLAIIVAGTGALVASISTSTEATDDVITSGSAVAAMPLSALGEYTHSEPAAGNPVWLS